MMKTQIVTWLIRAYFYLSIAAILVAYGFAIDHYKIFPYGIVKGSAITVKQFMSEEKNEFPGLNPARYLPSDAITNHPEAMSPGVTLIGVPWKEGDEWVHSVRLVDRMGATLHRWTIDPTMVWDTSPHHDLLQGKKLSKVDTHIHGVVLLPDGDVVFNLSHFALIRLNALSQIVWKLPYRTHHSVYLDDNGHFWVSGEKYHDKTRKEFPGIAAPFVEDTILEVSQDGAIMREISILESIYMSGYEGLLFSISSHRKKNVFDITHNNDVEILESRMAAAFPGLSAGDILVSLRNISTLLIIDGKTGLVKWACSHPFVFQHDPDFQEDGSITVFDNRPDIESSGAPTFGGSRIVRIRPFSNDFEVIYQSNETNYFYTKGGGKHQLLDNGNLLIAEPYAGRVFEVNGSGEVVWSWLADNWDKTDRRVPEVFCGTRYPERYAAFLQSGSQLVSKKVNGNPTGGL